MSFLTAFGIYVLVVCAFVLGAILCELEKIRKALTEPVIQTNVVSHAWEPIETNGWAGEPQGMEKAP